MNPKAGLVMNWHWRRINRRYLPETCRRHAERLYRALTKRAVLSAGTGRTDVA
jgi:hypothetical protein